MAPFKKIKTYQNPRKPNPPTKSERGINDLLTNLTNIGISPQRSYNTLRETTFDRLLKGQHYNNVVLTNHPEYISSSGELSYSLLECTKNKTRDHLIASNSNNSDLDIQTPDSLDVHNLKSSFDRSPIITRSKIKFQQSPNIQSDTERLYGRNKTEFSQAKKNTYFQCVSNLQETNRSNPFESRSLTKNDSATNITNVSKHISLKQIDFVLEDELIKKKKFRNHLHLNISGFKFEILRNTGSTPVISNLVKIKRRKTKHKCKTRRSSINSISREGNTRRLNEESTPYSKRCAYISFVKENISNLSNCKYETEKLRSLSTKHRPIVNNNSSKEQYRKDSESVENVSRVNTSHPSTVKTIGKNEIIQDQLNSMACSSRQQNESTKSEQSRIVNNQQNHSFLQNSCLSNPYLITSTPLHKSKSIIELIDISSENETHFTAGKPTFNFSSNILQLASSDQTDELKNCHVLKKCNYKKISGARRELPNCLFLHKANNSNEQNETSCSDKIVENETENLEHSEDELRSKSQYEKADENYLLIGDKHIDPINISQMETETCSKKEINANSSENNSENYDFVDSSITTQQPIMKKFVSLAAGKKFRRSMIIHKNTMDSSRDLKGDVSSDKITYSVPKRTSIKVVPITSMKATMSGLENYAAKLLVPEEDLERIKNSSDQLLSSVKLATFIKQPIIPTSARNIVLQRCRQTEPLTFEECYTPSALQHCQKIGEGVYGEVFMYRDENSSLTVMKIIPIEGDQIVNLEKQKTFEEIISEIIISAELSHLRKDKCNKTDSFTEVKKIRCVKGSYPQRLLELWDLYDENKHSENDSPEIFHSDQLYIVLELSNGGRDLEAFQFKNAQQSLAVFNQIACAIAVAEEELHFEHRDLHWGNVLVEITTQEYSNFILKGKEIAINNKDVKATIIDFTLSRIEYNGMVIFNDLALDNDLFSATGDYQFEVYRLMQKNNGNEWQSFKPYSNVLWLHYILDKAITAFRYKNIKSKLHKTSLKTLKEYKEKILDYQSVTEFIMNDFVS